MFRGKPNKVSLPAEDRKMSDALRLPERPSERRLLEMRRFGEENRTLKAEGIRPPGAPFPQASPDSGY